MNIHTFIVEALPIVVRVAVAIAQGPVMHWAFHRIAHLGIHQSIHRCSFLGRLEHHFRWIPDAMMIALYFVTEGESGHELHSAGGAE